MAVLNGYSKLEGLMVSTVEKGDELENKFHQYLLDQQSQGDLVYGAYPPQLCRIYKKKKYFCQVRDAKVEFDVVIELYRKGRPSPHLIVVFECKNQKSPIKEKEINDFSAKLDRIFKHGAKGVIVVSSRLQSGADKVARNSRIGIVKYDQYGFEISAERKTGTCAEKKFLRKQIFENVGSVKSLKFSAYHDGKFYGSVDQLLRGFASNRSVDGDSANDSVGVSVPYVSVENIKVSAQNILTKIEYETGPVDLKKICSVLSIDLKFTNQAVQDGDGNFILGSANFDRKSILINSHDDKKRERFTIGHEIGHFCLNHARYLRSESILESDLILNDPKSSSFNYERLEFQANTFASNLILPENIFSIVTAKYRERLNIKNRGFGYIYVDDQPYNYGIYNQLLSMLSSYFEVSKQVIEIKFGKMGMLTDKRKRPENCFIPPIIANEVSLS
ncbi:MAG: ImmA/IrrE family metallo-endopeptidase [Rhizobiaceae bacterium]|nr:ImmA/IrrE family metallo-endopeptidase [Rhizobiaceae bacterium]